MYIRTWPITKNAKPKRISPSGQRSSSVFTTRMIWEITYTMKQRPLMIKTKAQSAPGLWYEKGPMLRNVRIAMTNTIRKMTNELIRRDYRIISFMSCMTQPTFAPFLTQSDSGVPSSANWKPTKPLINKHQKLALTTPKCIAAKYYTMQVSHLNVVGYLKDNLKKRTYRICSIGWRNNIGDQEHFEEYRDHVQVKEKHNFLAT